jgi:hypothetical protein
VRSAIIVGVRKTRTVVVGGQILRDVDPSIASQCMGYSWHASHVTGHSSRTRVILQLLVKKMQNVGSGLSHTETILLDSAAVVGSRVIAVVAVVAVVGHVVANPSGHHSHKAMN